MLEPAARAQYIDENYGNSNNDYVDDNDHDDNNYNRPNNKYDDDRMATLLLQSFPDHPGSHGDKQVPFCM